MTSEARNQTAPGSTSNHSIIQLSMDAKSSNTVNQSGRQIMNENMNSSCHTSATRSTMSSKQAISRSRSSSNSDFTSGYQIAPIPCVVSSILRKQHFGSAVTLHRDLEMNELIDTMGILSNETCETESTLWEVETQDYFQSGFIPTTTVLQGVAGAGKTTLAAMLCHRPDVRNEFGLGGIAWVNLNKYNCSNKKNWKQDVRIQKNIEEESLAESRKETKGSEQPKKEQRKSRGWLGSSIAVEDQTNLEKKTPEEVSLDDEKSSHNEELFDLKDERESLLGFRGGIAPLNDIDLVECYITICHQLNISVPVIFQEIVNKMSKQLNDEIFVFPTEPYDDLNTKKESYRQIMATHLQTNVLNKRSRRTRNRVEERKHNKILIVLDNIWHPDNIEWFQFNLIESNIHVLATTRISTDFGDVNYFKLGTFSDDEASKIILYNATIQVKKELKASNENSMDGFPNSLSGIALVNRIISFCGNLPAALISISRWINNIIITQRKSIRKAMEDVADTLESSNFFNHDPERFEKFDLFKVLSRSLDSTRHGTDISRVLKLCLASFAIIFAKRSKKISHDNGTGTIPLCIPVEYVKIIWDHLLGSDVISRSERKILYGVKVSPQKSRNSFEKLKDAFITLGIMDSVRIVTSDKRQVSCLKLSHPIYQAYGEFLFKDKEDHLQIHKGVSISKYETSWNSAIATICDKRSGRWDRWEMLQGTVDDHLFEMLPTYMIRGRMYDVALGFLTDKSFIQGRLAAMGISMGTKCHIADCELLQRYTKKEKNIDAKTSTITAFIKFSASLEAPGTESISGSIDDAEKSRQVSMALHDLASSLYKRKSYDGAMKFAEDCLERKKKAFGECHEEVASTMSLKANILDRKGIREDKFVKKALDLHLEALRMRQKSCTGMHPDIARSLVSIGNIHFHSDDHLEAINCLEEALHIRKHTVGDDNEESSEILCTLGLAYQEVEAYNKALVCYEKALQVKQIILGEDTKPCADIVSQIAKLHKEAKQNSLALQRFKEALRIFRTIGIERDDPDVVEATLFINWVSTNATREKRRQSFK